MIRRLFCACACMAIAFGAFAQTPPDVLRSVPDDPALPRVLIIGDSISMGYTDPVRALLAGKANVHRIAENGGPTSNGAAKIDGWLGQSRWDIIHFNFGLHDLKIMDDGSHQVELPAYEANLRKIVARLKATGARLIWATTTPVPNAKQSPERRSADVPAYNAAARAIMQENGIDIDDLYALVLPEVERIQRPANVHFTDEGYAVLANQVARQVAGALKPRLP